MIAHSVKSRLNWKFIMSGIYKNVKCVSVGVGAGVGVGVGVVVGVSMELPRVVSK